MLQVYGNKRLMSPLFERNWLPYVGVQIHWRGSWCCGWSSINSKYLGTSFCISWTYNPHGVRGAEPLIISSKWGTLAGGDSILMFAKSNQIQITIN